MDAVQNKVTNLVQLYYARNENYEGTVLIHYACDEKNCYETNDNYEKADPNDSVYNVWYFSAYTNGENHIKSFAIFIKLSLIKRKEPIL